VINGPELMVCTNGHLSRLLDEAGVTDLSRWSDVGGAHRIRLLARRRGATDR
jgi:hypothetical protein